MMHLPVGLFPYACFIIVWMIKFIHKPSTSQITLPNLVSHSDLLNLTSARLKCLEKKDNCLRYLTQNFPREELLAFHSGTDLSEA